MRLKYRKILITMLLVIEILLVNLTYQSFLHREITKEENKITKKQFAMYIKENDKYVEYKSDDLFPKGYYVNKSLSKCVDENDNPVENVISSIGNSVTITSNKTIYCTLYFDKNEILEYLRSKDTNNSLSEDIVGDMYRYQGIYTKAEDGNVTSDVENYLCLGEDCSEYGEDLYRIIGVTETGELKVIKKTTLPDTYQWNTDIKADIEWPDSDLFHRLNDYGEGTYKDNSFYSTINAKLKQLIIKKEWMYGDTNITNVAPELYDGDTIYAIENGQKETTHYEYTGNGYESVPYKWYKSVEAYIGLQYINDYIYAYPGGKPNSFDVAKTSWAFWLNNDSDPSIIHCEWLVSRYGVYTTGNYCSRAVDSSGKAGDNTSTNLRAVRPVFYLSNDILITGEGTLAEPFKIGLEDENNQEYFDYNFKGNYETFTVPKDGTYKIELWGASGGDFEGYNGGKGAYTSGNINLNKGEYLYIYVGESGNTKRIASFNGGGANNDLYGAGGGGASDVRLTEEKWNNFDSLKSRIMVAAGGGGANNRNISNFMGGYYFGAGKGGSGGALVGGDGESLDETHTNPENSMSYGWTYGKGASQEAGGEIENYCNTCDSKTVDDYSGTGQFGYAETGQSGGGSGYYAGGSSLHGGAGGGSSYISGYPGCKAITKESTESNITHSDSPDHYSGKVFSESVMIAGNDTMPNYNGGTMVGNAGNGYARITKIK